MAESQPLLKVKRKSVSNIEKDNSKIARTENKCILCYENCDEVQKNLSQGQWEDFQKCAEAWKDLDTYGQVYDEVNWQSGPMGNFWHKSCKLQFSGKRKLEQAKNRQKKIVSSNALAEAQVEEAPTQTLPQRATRTSIGTEIHNKMLCVWCMKPGDDRHNERKRKKFHKIEQLISWYIFKEHVTYLEDGAMKLRLEKLIQSISDPFASEIRYHKSCWDKHITPLQKSFSDQKLHTERMNYQQVKNTFFRHVHTYIFEEGEPRFFKGLTLDSQNFLLNYGIQTQLKPSDVKTILQEEFGEKIGFQLRYRKNESTIVYDRNAGGDYIEAALNFSGMDNDFKTCSQNY